jgi:hypothetical protein
LLQLNATFNDLSPVLLAVLGRGIQQDSTGKWVLTDLLEVCNEVGAHLAVQPPEDDNNPNSCIGGGKINLLAGVELYKYFRPALTVFAYGARTKYLHEIGAPSESRVMTEEFLRILESESPTVEVFGEAAWGKTAAGTFEELDNIFTRAIHHGIKNVAIVTVAVHVPRTALMVSVQLNKSVFDGKIFPQIYTSELILESARPVEFRGLFAKSVSSQSFRRTLAREIGLGGVYPRGGINSLFAGTTHTASSVAATAKK